MFKTALLMSFAWILTTAPAAAKDDASRFRVGGAYGWATNPEQYQLIDVWMGLSSFFGPRRTLGVDVGVWRHRSPVNALSAYVMSGGAIPVARISSLRVDVEPRIGIVTYIRETSIPNSSPRRLPDAPNVGLAAATALRIGWTFRDASRIDLATTLSFDGSQVEDRWTVWFAASFSFLMKEDPPRTDDRRLPCHRFRWEPG